MFKHDIKHAITIIKNLMSCILIGLDTVEEIV